MPALWMALRLVALKPSAGQGPRVVWLFSRNAAAPGLRVCVRVNWISMAKGYGLLVRPFIRYVRPSAGRVAPFWHSLIPLPRELVAGYMRKL